MKPIFTALLVCSFLGIAFFGVFAMNHMGDQAHASCFGIAAQGATCPNKEAVSAFLDFHLDILRSFSNAVFEEAASFMFFAFFAAFGILVLQNARLDSPLFQFQTADQFSKPSSLWQRKLIHWLQLKQHSPDFA